MRRTLMKIHLNKIVLVFIFSLILAGCPKTGKLEGMMDCTTSYCEDSLQKCKDDCKEKGGVRFHQCNVGGFLPDCKQCDCANDSDSDISGPGEVAGEN